MSYIRVALNVPLASTFDYACEAATRGHIGCLVEVPFGRKRHLGVILEVGASPAVEPHKIRAAGALRTDLPALPADLLELLVFCSNYYHHPIGEVVAAALPTLLRTVRTVREPAAAAFAITEKGRAALAAGMKRAPAASALLALLAQEPLNAQQVGRLSPATRRVLRRLHAAEYVSRTGIPPPESADPDGNPVQLTAGQERALAQIEGAAPGFRVWLLHGVTGSGKTEVYLKVMAGVLERGGQVLFLVPEIGLTPQLEAAIRARFGEQLVTLHSALASGERARNWTAAYRGAARIVLGTRSAVFAPLPALGLLVVDEEHDASYKQAESVRYSARDLAIWRARQRGVPIILGSATPSLESYYAVLQGRYSRIRLDQRPNGLPLPAIRLVATAGADPAGGVSATLLEAIRERLGRGEQVLVFINRRGYAPVLLCAACGWAPDCPRCSAHMVLHRTRARLLCHHCGHRHAIPTHCGGCGNADLQPVGFGTQRIEATLRSTLPQARLLRVDRDTTRPRGAWPAMRSAINEGAIDLLVGTQLLSKGHDFAGLSLVCVLNADRSLYSTDFRAAERLFAQLLQVAGRAGRGGERGEVLLQTAFPTHPLYTALQAQDYDAFARNTLEERRAAGLPPFVHQALLRAHATRIEKALEYLQRAAEIGTELADGVTLYDPAPAAMARLQGRERAQLLVQSASRPALQRFLVRWCERLWALGSGGARWVLDVDPLEL